MRPPKVLIVRFSSIGDIVLTTPVIRCVREQTGAEVHFLTKEAFAATLRHHPLLTRLWTIRKDVKEIAAELIEAGFTHVVDLHGNLRSWEVKQRLRWGHLRRGGRPPRCTTFPKLNLQKFLLTRFQLDRLPDVHIVDRYLSAAAPLGVSNDGRGLDYHTGDPAVDVPDGPFVAFVIGAAHATKCLEAQQMERICRNLPYPVLLIGGPAERELGQHLAASGRNTVNTCGRYTLNESAEVIRRASVVLTHDTGMMHVAAAFGKRIVSVWGNTVPALGMYPYLPGGPTAYVAEVMGLDCRPCSKIGYAECPKGHFRCMREQDTAAIERAVLLAVEAEFL